MNAIWVIIGVAIVLGLLSGGNKSNQRKSNTSGHARIDHPHVIDDEDELGIFFTQL